VVVAEIKLNKEKIDWDGLKEKSRRIVAEYPRYKFQWLSSSPQDVRDFLVDSI